MEESYELTSIGSVSDEEDETIILVDDDCIDESLAHHYLPHIFNLATSFGDEYGVKLFSLLMPHEEQEAPTCVHDELMNSPFHF